MGGLLGGKPKSPAMPIPAPSTVDNVTKDGPVILDSEKKKRKKKTLLDVTGDTSGATTLGGNTILGS